MSVIQNEGNIIFNINFGNNGTNCANSVEEKVTVPSETNQGITNPNVDFKSQQQRENIKEGSDNEPEQIAACTDQIGKPSDMRKTKNKPILVFLCVMILLAFLVIFIIFGIPFPIKSGFFTELIEWMLNTK